MDPAIWALDGVLDDGARRGGIADARAGCEVVAVAEGLVVDQCEPLVVGAGVAERGRFGVVVVRNDRCGDGERNEGG